MQNTVYISIGTNQGNKLKNLQTAINFINRAVGTVCKIAPIYKTTAWGFKGNDFYNTCIKIKTYFSAKKTMETLLSIEKKMGRIRNEQKRYSNRIIDLDILLFGNNIIDSKTVTVPHPRMLERKFVMYPLNDIAEKTIHPKTKKNIKTSLLYCTDKSEVLKIEKKLILPKKIEEQYNFIAIEGNIGAGKTSLANLLSAELNAKLILERYADNPFLPKFYKNKERYAFSLEMSFLAERYQQLVNNLNQFDLFKNCQITDYYIFKSLIFAQITLQKEEYKLYRKVFDIMYKETAKPNLYIFLYQNTTRLMKNIKKRNRAYEQNIKAEYLQNIHNGYINFIKTQQNLNTLIIDVSELDFVEQKEDFQIILNQITSSLKAII